VSFKVTSLDEVAPQVGAENSDWLRLRKALDVKACGVNAYGAEKGKRVIEEHDELGSAAGRHEELYLVVRGHARFELDGDEIDAPVGTAVFVRDPAVRRGAHAEEDGTLVLVAGGAPGHAYEVSIWEEAADAYPLWEQGDYAGAVKILRAVAEKHPQTGLILYNLACAETLNGEHDAGLEHLARATALEDRWRKAARDDPDFDAIRADPRFELAVAGQADSAG
jgi:mannose-6-phosphate isomerase-like protein (cupin superfamily)